jgi:hypothetical protein
MAKTTNAYNGLVGKPKRKKTLGRPRRRWESNINMDFKETGWKDTDWISLAQDRNQRRALVSTVMKPWDSIQCWDLLAS